MKRGHKPPVNRQIKYKEVVRIDHSKQEIRAIVDREGYVVTPKSGSRECELMTEKSYKLTIYDYHGNRIMDTTKLKFI